MSRILIVWAIGGRRVAGGRGGKLYEKAGTARLRLIAHVSSKGSHQRA